MYRKRSVLENVLAAAVGGHHCLYGSGFDYTVRWKNQAAFDVVFDVGCRWNDRDERL